MGSKVINSLFDKQREDNIKFMMYMFMMKLIGEGIYNRYSNIDSLSREVDRVNFQ